MKVKTKGKIKGKGSGICPTFLCSCEAETLHFKGVIAELVFVETGEKPECGFQVLYLELVDKISGSHL